MPIFFLKFTLIDLAPTDAFTVLPQNTYGILGANVTLDCELSNSGYTLSWKNPDGANVYEKGFGVLPGFEGQYDVTEDGDRYINLKVHERTLRVLTRHQ